MNILNTERSQDFRQDSEVIPSQQEYPSYPTISSITLENSKSFADKLASCGTLNLSAYALMKDMLDFISDKEEDVIMDYTAALISMNTELNPAISRPMAENTLGQLDRFVIKKNLELGESVKASLARVKYELSCASKGRITLQEKLATNRATIKLICASFELLGANSQGVSDFELSFSMIQMNGYFSPQFDTLTKWLIDLNSFLHSENAMGAQLIRRLSYYEDEINRLNSPCFRLIYVTLRNVKFLILKSTTVSNARLTKWNSYVILCICVFLMLACGAVSLFVEPVAIWDNKKTFSITLASFSGSTLLRRNSLPRFIAKLYYRYRRLKKSDAKNEPHDALEKLLNDPLALGKSLRGIRKHLIARAFNAAHVDVFVCCIWETYNSMIGSSIGEVSSIELFVEKLSLNIAALDKIGDLYDYLNTLKIEIPGNEKLSKNISELLNLLSDGDFEFKDVWTAIKDNILNYSITTLYLGIFAASIYGCIRATEDPTWAAAAFIGALGSIFSCYSPFCLPIPEWKWEDIKLKETLLAFWGRLTSPLSLSSMDEHMV